MEHLEKMVVGLTGNIASGKSKAAKIFGELGAYVIDADKVAHQSYNSLYLKYKLAKEFGISVLQWDFKVNRKKLGKIVFDDMDKKKRLEEIVWPYIKKDITNQISKTDKKIVIVEAALIFEAGWENMFDYVITVTCDDIIRLKRIIKRNKLTEEEAKKRIKAQMDQYTKAAQSDYIVKNNNDLGHLSYNVYALWSDLQKKLNSQVIS